MIETPQQCFGESKRDVNDLSCPVMQISEGDATPALLQGRWRLAFEECASTSASLRIARASRAVDSASSSLPCSRSRKDKSPRVVATARRLSPTDFLWVASSSRNT